MLRISKNLFSKEIRRAKTKYYRNRYRTNLGKWRSIKEEEDKENKGLLKARINNKTVTSQKQLAEEYAKEFIGKINKMKEDHPNNNIVAEKCLKHSYQEMRMI